MLETKLSCHFVYHFNCYRYCLLGQDYNDARDKTNLSYQAGWSPRPLEVRLQKFQDDRWSVKYSTVLQLTVLTSSPSQYLSPEKGCVGLAATLRYRQPFFSCLNISSCCQGSRLGSAAAEVLACNVAILIELFSEYIKVGCSALTLFFLLAI